MRESMARCPSCQSDSVEKMVEQGMGNRIINAEIVKDPQWQRVTDRIQ